MPAPSPDAFASARQAAYDCAQFSDRLILAATNDRAAKMPQAAERRLDQFRVSVAPEVAAANPWLSPPPPDPAAYIGAAMTAGLCEALDAGRGAIEPVEELLLRAAVAPIRLGDAMTRATAHQLAWDFARHLWSTVRSVLFDRGYEDDGDGFSLDNAAVLRAWKDVAKVLKPYGGLDVRQVAEAVKIESARAAALYADAAPPAVAKNVVAPRRLKRKGRPIKYPESLKMAVELLREGRDKDVAVYRKCKERFGGTEKLPRTAEAFMRTVRRHAAARNGHK